MTGSLQPLVLLQNFSGVNLSQVLKEVSLARKWGHRAAKQEASGRVRVEAQPSCEWVTPCCSGSTNISFLSRWPGDLGAAQAPGQSMGTSTQPGATACALGLATFSNQSLGIRVPHARLSLGVVTRVLGGFPAAALRSSTRVIYFSFTCFKTLRS